MDFVYQVLDAGHAGHPLRAFNRASASPQRRDALQRDQVWSGSVPRAANRTICQIVVDSGFVLDARKPSWLWAFRVIAARLAATLRVRRSRRQVHQGRKVDPVGACVGVRGSRIKNIVDELGGEKIDIVRWNESSQVLVSNALMPAKVSEIALCFELGRATVVVDEEQLSLAIGKHGQNVRLAARLTGWDIDILTPEEYNRGIEQLAKCIKEVEGVDDAMIDKLIALGVISVSDLEDVGVEPLVNELNIDSEVAGKLVAAAAKEVERLMAESKQNEAEKELAQQTKAKDKE